MNDGTYKGSAQAFKLDSLLKLADMKGSRELMGNNAPPFHKSCKIVREARGKPVEMARKQGLTAIASSEFHDNPLH
ncbi:hypothetical protein YC2023_015301 [Brassica napus]